ncbi:MAG: His-Xaa-Ser system radical SAM maturase HxsB [Deltaproteobacteria bacterium]|nr:His-Xaa-Ser system radical SAM maturase HxsB [Deltaproteobacteria bacterium]
MAVRFKGSKAAGLDRLSPFRFGRIRDQVLVTNEAGGFVLLSEGEFEALMEGSLDEGSPKHEELKSKHFFRSDEATASLARDYARKNAFLFSGPYLHIVIVTLRCNEVCVYCHASRRDVSEVAFDMKPELARQVVDTIFESPSPVINIEFQGGEPLVNWETVRFLIDYSVEKNRTARKKLEFSLVTNLSLMDDAKLAFLMSNNVQICTSIDGPKAVHDHNRKLLKGSSYDQAVQWMRKADQAYREKGLDPDLYHVEALLTVTRETLKHPREVVDEYVRLGRKAIFLRPLNPFGFAARTFQSIGYTPDEFLRFYFEAMDYMIDLNRRGVEILERTAAILLTKMLTPVDPNYLDLRSPCGAGIGQVAYNYDGTVFTCDEGRMLYQQGDDMFQIGTIPESRYQDLTGSPTVKALAVASCLDNIPGCVDCVFKPYCGVCPVYNYAQQGGIFGQMPTNERCRIYRSILEYLFGRIAGGEKQVLDILTKWTIVRDRSVFFSHD